MEIPDGWQTLLYRITEGLLVIREQSPKPSRMAASLGQARVWRNDRIASEINPTRHTQANQSPSRE